MLCVKKVIVICREVNSQTGQIAVYVVPMEIDEHTVVRLSLRSMKNQEKRPCPLCERHQRMETTSGMLFWVEWGEDGNPRLCTDTLHDGGGLNVLCIDFCPLCGREIEKQEALG